MKEAMEIEPVDQMPSSGCLGSGAGAAPPPEKGTTIARSTQHGKIGGISAPLRQVREKVRKNFGSKLTFAGIPTRFEPVHFRAK
jgi:hypothetical protein